MVSQLNQNLAQRSITVTVADEAKKWILNQTWTDRSTERVRCGRACRSTSKIRFGSLDSGHDHHPTGVHRGLPRSEQAVFTPGRRGKTEGVLLYEASSLGTGRNSSSREAKRASFQAVSESWRLCLCKCGTAPRPSKPSESSAECLAVSEC